MKLRVPSDRVQFILCSLAWGVAGMIFAAKDRGAACVAALVVAAFLFAKAERS